MAANTRTRLRPGRLGVEILEGRTLPSAGLGMPPATPLDPQFVTALTAGEPIRPTPDRVPLADPQSAGTRWNYEYHFGFQFDYTHGTGIGWAWGSYTTTPAGVTSGTTGSGSAGTPQTQTASVQLPPQPAAKDDAANTPVTVEVSRYGHFALAPAAFDPALTGAAGISVPTGHAVELPTLPATSPGDATQDGLSWDANGVWVG